MGKRSFDFAAVSMEADSSSIKEGNVVETKSLESGETFDSTDAQLLALGFKPELKRVHTFWTCGWHLLLSVFCTA